MNRISNLESKMKSIDSRVSDFEKKIKVEALRLAVVKGSENLLKNISPFSNTLIKAIARMV